MIRQSALKQQSAGRLKSKFLTDPVILWFDACYERITLVEPDRAREPVISVQSCLIAT
ncbi:MAG: hypothetical protein RMK32_03885 [Anaerolineae bacterium]|nr:hypothetical protein [Thermoflexus sp.]MDW8064756.1 hypothetical protein [Anaerolineae bacterium]